MGFFDYDAFSLSLAAVLSVVVFLFWWQKRKSDAEWRRQVELQAKEAEKEEESKRVREPDPDPARVFTLEQLNKYNGEDKTSPIYIAVQNKVWDVTESEQMYGPGQAYGAFAGKSADRALAKMSVDSKEADNLDLSDLTRGEKDTLKDWVRFFENKYTQVGVLDTKSKGKGVKKAKEAAPAPAEQVNE